MSEDDFDRVVLFLIEYRWIYDFKLTRYCVDKAYANIPHEWREVFQTLSYEDLSNLPFGRLKDGWPSSLKEFVRSCLAYSIPRDQVTLLPWKQDAHILTEDCNQLSPNLSDETDGDRSSIVTSSCSFCSKVTSEFNYSLDINTSGRLTLVNVPHSKKEDHADTSGTRKNSGDLDQLNIAPCTALNQLSEEGPDVSLGHSFQTNLVKDSRLLKSDINTSDAMNSEILSQFVSAGENFNKIKKPMSKKNTQNRRIASHVAVSENEVRRGMSEKKWHEVHHMTAVIDHVTKTAGNNVIVDVGSGLGYLGHVLHTKYGHNVLGLEGKQGHAQGAVDRLKISDSCGRLQNITCEIYDNKKSESEFIQILHDWFSNLSNKDKSCCHYVDQSSNKTSLTKRSQKHHLEKEPQTTRNMNNEPESRYRYTTDDPKAEGLSSVADDLHDSDKPDEPGYCYGDPNKLERNCENNGCPNVCMVGLHCCGDLTPTMLKYFSRIDWITSLCLVSCCYHRMSVDDHTQQLENFPMSECLKKVVYDKQKLFPGFRFSPFCLRLAAQETRARWLKQTPDDHDLHMRNVAFRAVLEYCIVNGDGKFLLKKTARKLAHKVNFDSFNAYMKTTYKHIEVQDPDPEVDYMNVFEQKMVATYKQFEDSFSLIEPLTALQYLVQPVIESVIYKDRLRYLVENGFHGNIKPIFHEFISPRNLAIIAFK